MASEDTVLRWLEALRFQTELGNIQWRPGRSRQSYLYSATESSVAITSVDGDGMAPFRVVVFDAEGQRRQSFFVSHPDMAPTDEPASPAIQAKIVEVWDAIMKQHGKDPIASMLDELDSMPPF